MGSKQSLPHLPRKVSILRRRRLWLAAAVVAAALGAHALRVIAAPRSQIAVFRPTTGEWFIRQDDGGATRIPFGAPGDVPVARDYLAQGRAQLAVFRPSTREWFIRRDDGSVITTPFGGPDDQPIPGDYLGLGRAQLAVFRPSTREWFIRQDSGEVVAVQFGGPEDQPVPGDYLGLNRLQFAVFRPSTQQWLIRQDDGGLVSIQWGGPGDRPAPGDYLALRRSQVAVFRPGTGEWFIRQDNGQPVVIQFGGPDDVPMTSDYDGNERTKIAVFRPPTQEWFLRSDDGSAVRVQFGGPGDVPVPAAYAITSTPPPTPPAAPSNLTATANSATQISLTWTDNSGDETGFQIERRSGSGAFAEIASVGANTTGYADSGLTASTSYTYRVRALNAGGASAYSNESTATTQPPPVSPPAAPSNLVATANSQTQITLTWRDNSSNETGFRVERRSGGGAFTEIASVGANVVTYVNAGLTAATSYTYRVRAVNAGGPSAYSNEATASTQAPPPALSLATDIQPIFTANCALAGCHGSQGPQAGMDLSAGRAYSQIVDVNSQSVPSKKRVAPGDPANSFLYEKISQANPSVGSRMPLGGQLSQADIDKIRQWIEQGARP